MNITDLLNDKSLKPKVKIETLSKWILDKKISLDDLIHFAKMEKDTHKATCIEAIEYATKQNPSIANEKCLLFVSEMLTEKAPRIKWESARVIGNIAHLFPSKLEKAIVNLLVNSQHQGTVVRWSAAFALGEIIKLNTKWNMELLSAVDAICQREEQNSIRKIYINALKKINKKM